jgi:hypothetical protein
MTAATLTVLSLLLGAFAGVLLGWAASGVLTISALVGGRTPTKMMILSGAAEGALAGALIGGFAAVITGCRRALSAEHATAVPERMAVSGDTIGHRQPPL